MNFNFHAVSKKDRIKKTLLLGIPATLVIGFLGSFVIMVGDQIGFNFTYYAAILVIGYAVGTMVRKIGRGTTYEFLIIAGVYGFVATILAMFLSFRIQGYPIPFTTFFISLFDFANFMSGFNIIEAALSSFVAIYLANTVQM